MSEQNKIQAKIGAAEFSAEGPAAVDAYARWIEAVTLSLRGSPIPSTAQSSDFSTRRDRNEEHEKDDAGVAGKPVDGITDRAFRVDDKTGLVTLKALPKGDLMVADSMLLLLYGFQACMKADSVLGGTLMKAAAQSGVLIARADRAIEHHQAYIVAAGQKRGRKYGLNNPGLQYAEKLMKGLFD